MAQIEFGPKRAVGALKSWNFIVFNAGAPKAEQVAAVQYYDWLASNQDNIDLWLFGIDGVNYKKLPNLRFSEIPGLDQTKNYRRLWYVGGIPGKYWRYDITTPDDALAAYNWEQNVANFDFDPYEGFNIDTTVDNVATLTAQLQAAWAEAYHGFGTGQVDTTDAIATMKKTLDDAGRPAYMAAIQKQMDAYIAANKA
jgi:putative aldouronate transport system substrate-binding protein